MGTSMFSAVTGLLAHQRKMDVIANNIANVSTTGYRGSRMMFQNLLSQTLEGGAAPNGDFGGTNPLQIGLGVGIGSIDVNHTQGALLTTGISSDLAIQGNGFFILSNGNGAFYTRDGTFDLNAAGVLIDPATGLRVRGYTADANGVIDTNLPPGDLIIPIGNTSIVRETQNAVLRGNLNSSATDGTTTQRTLRVYDSLGTPRDVVLTFTKRAQVDSGGTLYNAWSWSAQFDGTDVTNVPAGQEGVLLFDSGGAFFAEGALDTGTGTFTARSALPSQDQVSIPPGLFPGSSLPTTPFEFAVDFSEVSQLAEENNVTVFSQDGFPLGVLETYEIATDGTINGIFTNGLMRTMGQISMAWFPNVGGLERRGENLFIETSSSGLAQIGAPGTGGRGTIAGGTLENSNVDLGTEFSNMIITQRAYQANARTITTADTMLQEAVNLVR